MLRTTLNQDYFHDLFNMSERFGIQIEGHRASSPRLRRLLRDAGRHGDGPRRVRDGARVHGRAAHGRQRDPLQAARQERGHQARHHAQLHGQAVGQRPSPPLSARVLTSGGQLPGCSGHTHVSLRTKDGKNLFAVPDGKPRADAQYDDTKYLSQEAEWFLAGVLEGLADSASRCCNRRSADARSRAAARADDQRVQAPRRRRGASCPCRWTIA